MYDEINTLQNHYNYLICTYLQKQKLYVFVSVV